MIKLFFQRGFFCRAKLTQTITNSREVLVVPVMTGCVFGWKQPANSLWTEEVSNLFPIASLFAVHISRPLVCTW